MRTTRFKWYILGEIAILGQIGSGSKTEEVSPADKVIELSYNWSENGEISPKSYAFSWKQALDTKFANTHRVWFCAKLLGRIN